MTAKLTPEQIQERVTRFGRTCVRMVEATDVMLSFEPEWTERLLLQMVKALYQRRLRELVKDMPAGMTAEIRAASGKMTGPVREFTQN